MTQRGRPKGSGKQGTEGRYALRVYPSADDLETLREGARLAGGPEDGRSGGPAIGPWLLELGLAEARRLQRRKRRYGV